MARITDNFTDSSKIAENKGGSVSGGKYCTADRGGAVCYRFEETLIDCGSVGAFNPLRLQVSEATFCMWVRLDTDGSGGWHTLVDKSTGAAAANGYGIYVRKSGDSWEVRGYYSGVERFRSKTFILKANEWFHLTCKGDLPDTDEYVYINGNKVWQGGVQLVGPNATANLALGRQATVTTLPLKGWMKDVRIYRIGLSPYQIQQVMRGDEPSASNLVGWYKLDEGSGTTAANSGTAGSGNDGTITAGSGGWATDQEFYNVRARLTSTNLLASVTSTAVQNFRYQIAQKPGNREQRVVFSNDNFVTSLVNQFGTKADSSGSYNFDGQNDYMVHSAAIISDFPFTISAWTKTAGYSKNEFRSDRVIVQVGSSSNATNTLGIGMDTSGYIYCNADSGTRNVPATPNSYGYDGKWHHIVGVFTSDSSRSLYVDGRFISTNTSTVSVTPASWNRIVVGSTADSSQVWWWREFLAGIRVWNVSLSAADVLDIYLYNKDNNSANLQAWWDLNDLNDSSGNGYTLTKSGATQFPNWTLSPPRGPVMVGQNGINTRRFDGVDDYVRKTSVTSIHGLSSASMSCWVNCPVRPTTDTNILGIPETVAGTHGFHIKLGAGSVSNDKIIFSTNTSTTGVSELTYQGGVSGEYNVYSFSYNKWHHIAVVLDGGTRSLYLDGNLCATDSVVGTIVASSDTLVAAVFSLSSGTYFNGMISNAAVWKDARTAAEVEASYRQGYEDTSDANLIVYWPLNDESTTAVDATSNANDGTISGPINFPVPTRPLPKAETAETVLNITAANFTSAFYYRYNDHSLDAICGHLSCLESAAVDYIDGDETTLTGWLWGWM